MSYKIFALNPGSTSTKVALFEDRHCVFKTTIEHSHEDLAQFPSVPDQFSYRLEAIIKAVEDAGQTFENVDCFVGRCGSTKPCEGGIYRVTEKVLGDVAHHPIVHPAMLGGRLTDALANRYGGEKLFLNPPDTDEFQDIARITGFSDVLRTSNVHMLNQKETVIVAAKEMGRRPEDCNFIVAHIGGGVSVTAHQHGRAIDSTNNVAGEGPLTPTRSGAMPLLYFMDLCYSGKYTRDEMYKRLTKTGGFTDLLGTNDIREVKQMIKAGDEYAKVVYDAFIYQIGKAIGSMASVLHGNVDAILLGGGIVYDEDLVKQLKEMCGYIAPIRCYPGEFEMEALAFGALRALTGAEKIKEYTGEPTFKGFDTYQRVKMV